MTVTDITAIADICHRRGKPLIVDEAWGAHLPFHQDLPTWAMDAGADVCVVSVHKMGTGFEQGSVSACTRWAPASSRDRSSTSKAT